MPLGKKIQDCVPPVSKDLALDVCQDTVETDSFVNRCVDAVTDSLKVSVGLFTQMHREQLAQVFFSMRHTHRSIHDLLTNTHENPKSVDARPLVRCQVETLFAICLICEQPLWIETYLKNGWKAQYLYHLVMTQQCRDLPRFIAELDRHVDALEAMRNLAEVSEEEKATIDADELGTPLPSGFQRKRISNFPTPGGVLAKIKRDDTKRMLLRIYPEYQFLCTYVHASPHGRCFRGLFDRRSPFQPDFTSGQLEEMFAKEIAAPAIMLDLLSIAQCCCEFVPIYPFDVELRAILTKTWNVLLEKTMIGRAIWDLRTKNLLQSL